MSMISVDLSIVFKDFALIVMVVRLVTPWKKVWENPGPFSIHNGKTNLVGHGSYAINSR